MRARYVRETGLLMFYRVPTRIMEEVTPLLGLNLQEIRDDNELQTQKVYTVTADVEALVAAALEGRRELPGSVQMVILLWAEKWWHALLRWPPVAIVIINTTPQ